MPSYKIVFLEQAISEMSESVIYYNEKSPELGFEFEEEVFHVVGLIKDNPSLFPIKFANIHEAIVARFPFVIVYEVVGIQILVLAVFHFKRQPETKYKKNRKQR